MAHNSKIEWTDHTFNPWWGCTKVSPACAHCYAEAWAKRTGFDVWDAENPRRFLSETYWQQPQRWNKEAEQSGQRVRVFCASMADVFELRSDLSPWRSRLWRLIDDTPWIDWLLLTKRPHLVGDMVPWGSHWPENVWLGITVENQRWADERIPHLAQHPARIRFLSCEPLLDSVRLEMWLQDGIINWVIAGGESGPKSRPSDPSWFHSLRDQCAQAATPFHFKQWGDWAPMDAASRPHPNSVITAGYLSTPMGRFGKKIAGRLLCGRTWDEVPSHSDKLHCDTPTTREATSAVWTRYR